MLKQKLLNQYDEKLVNEFFKFMEIKKLNNDYDAEICSPSPIIDDVWHTAILYTKDYREYCGDTFIDHNPDGFNDKIDVIKERYYNTHIFYYSLFNESPPKAYWPEQIGCINNANNLTIYIINLLGKRISVHVNESDTIQLIKKIYYSIDGISVDQQRFIYSGKQLEDNKTLSYYNIKSESTIHMVLRLNGC